MPAPDFLRIQTMYKFTPLLFIPLFLSLVCNTALHASTCSATVGLEKRLTCYDALAMCSTLDSDAKRLACYENRDTTESESKTQTQVQPAAKEQSRTLPKTLASSTPPVSTNLARDRHTANTIETHISNTRMNRSEILHIYLDNGQVWKEITRSRFRYKKGQKVSISFTASGAARLHAEGMKKYAKVSQVK